MRLYKLYKPPYNEKYVFSSDTPKIWWNSVDGIHDCLQKLALLIHDITPNSAACERNFSTLGWIYGKRRLRLSISKVESMAKIRSYYLSMINKELKYPGESISASELKYLVEETLDDQEEEEEEEMEEMEEEEVGVEVEVNRINEEPIVPNHQVFVVIENFFDLNEVPFVLDPDDVDDGDGSSSDNNTNDEVDESIFNEDEDDSNDYNLDDIVQNYTD
jgi:hypothetical protein